MFFCVSLFAQTHSSVTLENHVYYILEQAEIRGLCTPLPGTRPYTQNVVIEKINEILNSENSRRRLGDTEREILNQYLEKFSKPVSGFDWQRGGFYGEAAVGEKESIISANIGIFAEMEGSSGSYSDNGYYYGTEIWAGLFLNGDLGRFVSYNFIYEGGLMKAPRKFLGVYNTYYSGFDNDNDPEFQNRPIDVYSEPLTHFPYTYKKRWDGSIFYFNSLSSFEPWPESVAGGYSLPTELTASFFDNMLIMRLGRISREWGSTAFGSSLAFNQTARPFLAIEAEFNPVSWFGISSLTGILEYHNTEGIYESPKTNQNAFSITMYQFKYKNYLFFDIVDAVIWPKRFELGYISPITFNFFNQNNVGKFDNMAITLNLKAQYPGLGSIWFSLFVDEMNFLADWDLDRQMFAYQAGINVPLPVMSFSSIKMSYTKINPYCYTHHRNFLPMYGENLMEKSYTNNGVGLGYYLPPNSDEILFSYKTMPARSVIANLQYQLIRHGANFGPNAVDGSNLLSELDPYDRNGNPVLKRFFLRDGAYQWNHIIKAGIEWNMPGLPVTLFGEAGTVITFFTDIDGPANSGFASPYSRVNTEHYTDSTGIIVKLGFRLYPRW